MPVFQADIEKRVGREYFTNVYYVNAATIVEAAAASVRIAAFEQYFHKDAVVFEKARVRTPAEGDDIFVNTPLGFLGLQVNQPAQQLPLFNVLRVDFGVATGRPSRKYYRVLLNESDIESANVAQALRDVVTLRYGEMVADLGGLGVQHVDIDGQLVVNCVPQIPIGMRQLRRGSRRRTQPILP